MGGFTEDEANKKRLRRETGVIKIPNIITYRNKKSMMQLIMLRD